MDALIIIPSRFCLVEFIPAKDVTRVTGLERNRYFPMLIQKLLLKAFNVLLRTEKHEIESNAGASAIEIEILPRLRS